MNVSEDEGRGQKIDSLIRLNGEALGINLFLDEVVTQYKSPYQKTWQTVGDLNPLVVGHYKMSLEIKPERGGSKLIVSIDYELPMSHQTRWLGLLFGGVYAKWCVRQITKGTLDHFTF